MQKYHNFIFGIEGYCNFLAALFEPICWIKGWIPEMVKYVLFSYVLFEKNISQAFFYNMVHRNAAILGSIIGGYCPSVASKFCLGHLLLNCFLVNFMTNTVQFYCSCCVFYVPHCIYRIIFVEFKCLQLLVSHEWRRNKKQAESWR